MPRSYSPAVPIILGCAQFMHQFDGSAIATALPSMAATLNENPLRLNLAISCYLLALAVFVPVSGWMADRFGAKRVFIAAIIVFTASSVLCGISHSLLELVLARILQGVGGAMMTPVGRVIIVKSVPRSELVKAMNAVSLPGVLAPILGPSVGGFIVSFFSWPWIFFVNVPIGILGVILVSIYVPDLREERVARLDVTGFLLAGVGLASLVFGFETMGRDLVAGSITATLVAAGVICCGLYYWHARRCADPIIDLRLLRFPTFATALTGGAFFYMGTTSVVYLIALLLQLGFGYSAFEAGLTTLAIAAGSLLTRFTFRPVLAALGFRSLLIAATAITGIYLFINGAFRPATPFLLLLAVFFIGGLARSMAFIGVQSLTYADMPRDLMSRATSFSALSQQFAQSFGVGLTALVVHMSVVAHGGENVRSADLTAGFVTIGLASLVATFIFVRMPREAGAALEAKKVQP